MLIDKRRAQCGACRDLGVWLICRVFRRGYCGCPEHGGPAGCPVEHLPAADGAAADLLAGEAEEGGTGVAGQFTECFMDSQVRF